MVRKHCRKSRPPKDPSRACVKPTGQGGIHVGPYHVPRKTPKKASPKKAPPETPKRSSPKLSRTPTPPSRGRSPPSDFERHVALIKSVLELDPALSAVRAIRQANEMLEMEPRDGLAAQAAALVQRLGYPLKNESPKSPVLPPRPTPTVTPAKTSSPASPPSAVFHRISELQGRPSVLAFRQHCAFRFPHPILLHTRTGIEMPRRTNLVLAIMWNVNHYTMELCKHLPYDRENCAISYTGRAEESKFLSPEVVQYFYAGKWYTLSPDNLPKILVGVRTFSRKEGEKVIGAHLVFFEAHFATRTVHIVDPNGISTAYLAVIQSYFRGWNVQTTHVYKINISDTSASPAVEDIMRSLGFGMLPAEKSGGNCATVGLFFLVDYMCTRQWERTLAVEEPGSFVDRGYARDHFFRASRDWLYSNEELAGSQVSPVALQVRLFVMARYISYQLTALLTSKNPEFKKRITLYYKRPQKKSMVTLRALPSTFESQSLMTSHYRVRTHEGEQDVRFTTSTVSLDAVRNSGAEVLARKLF